MKLLLYIFIAASLMNCSAVLDADDIMDCFGANQTKEECKK